MVGARPKLATVASASSTLTRLEPIALDLKHSLCIVSFEVQNTRMIQEGKFDIIRQKT